MISFHLHVSTKNESNTIAPSWHVVSRSRKRVKAAIAPQLNAYMPSRVHLPCVVTLTRVSTGTLDDDGLRSALKIVRDAIAERIGVDDGDTERIQFQYAQARGKRGVHVVRVDLHEGKRLVEALVDACRAGGAS